MRVAAGCRLGHCQGQGQGSSEGRESNERSKNGERENVRKGRDRNRLPAVDIQDPLSGAIPLHLPQLPACSRLLILFAGSCNTPSGERMAKARKRVRETEHASPCMTSRPK